MDRRKFVVGTGIGLGLAGCLDANTGGAVGGTETEDEEQLADADRSTPDESTANATGSDDQAGPEGNDSVDESEDDTRREDGEDTGTDGDDSERDVTFHSCTRATVSGSFEEGDVAFASTDFYDDGLYGNTVLEDGVVFGEDVDAPFSGTVAFEIGSESAVRDGADEIVVEIPSYGSDGTVISALTTEREDYLAAGTTHGNPDASECLREIEPDEKSGATDGEGDATFDIVRLETNTPIDAGDYLEVSATIENTGGTDGTQDLELIVGHSAERIGQRSVSLSAGDRTELTMGYETPLVGADQEFPIRLESEDDTAERSVLVYGTG